MTNIEKRLRQEADNLFFEACLKKYGNKCMICGRLYDKAHHFFCKGEYLHLRYDLENGTNICLKHHSLIHQTGDKKEVEKQIIEIRGNKWFSELRKKANNMPYSFKNEKWYRDNIIRLKKYLNEKEE